MRGQNWTRPGDYNLEQRNKQRKPSKVFFSETERHRVFIFDALHLLGDFYHVCSNDAPGGQNWPHPEDYNLEQRNKQRKSSEVFFSETEKHRTFIFDVLHLLVDFYHVCLNAAPGF